MKWPTARAPLRCSRLDEVRHISWSEAIIRKPARGASPFIYKSIDQQTARAVFNQCFQTGDHFVAICRASVYFKIPNTLEMAFTPVPIGS